MAGFFKKVGKALLNARDWVEEKVAPGLGEAREAAEARLGKKANNAIDKIEAGVRDGTLTPGELVETVEQARPGGELLTKGREALERHAEKRVPGTAELINNAKDGTLSVGDLRNSADTLRTKLTEDARKLAEKAAGPAAVLGVVPPIVVVAATPRKEGPAETVVEKEEAAPERSQDRGRGNGTLAGAGAEVQEKVTDTPDRDIVQGNGTLAGAGVETQEKAADEQQAPILLSEEAREVIRNNENTGINGGVAGPNGQGAIASVLNDGGNIVAGGCTQDPDITVSTEEKDKKAATPAAPQVLQPMAAGQERMEQLQMMMSQFFTQMMEMFQRVIDSLGKKEEEPVAELTGNGKCGRSAQHYTENGERKEGVEEGLSLAANTTMVVAKEQAQGVGV